MNETLMDPVPTFRIGRKRTLHRVRVLIEDNRVVVRTRCGIDPTAEGFTETFGIPTCDECERADRG